MNVLGRWMKAAPWSGPHLAWASVITAVSMCYVQPRIPPPPAQLNSSTLTQCPMCLREDIIPVHGSRFILQCSAGCVSWRVIYVAIWTERLIRTMKVTVILYQRGQGGHGLNPLPWIFLHKLVGIRNLIIRALFVSAICIPAVCSMDRQQESLPRLGSFGSEHHRDMVWITRF